MLPIENPKARPATPMERDKYQAINKRTPITKSPIINGVLVSLKAKTHVNITKLTLQQKVRLKDIPELEKP